MRINLKLSNLIYTLIFSVLGILSYVLLINYSNLPLHGGNALYFLWGYLFFVAAFNFIGISLIKLTNWVGSQYNRYMTKKWRITLLYLLVATVLFLMNYSILVTAKMVAGLHEPFIFPNGGYRILIIVWLLELIVFGLLLVNSSVINSIELQKRAAYLQEENDKARYIALQNQLNPHFLFNSLNTLIAEIEYNPSNAVSFTRNLSEVYRYVLQCQNRPLVSLREEINFMESFIFLHKVRLGDYIKVECKINDDYYESQLPTLTLQLLVENVIKHNSITPGKPMTISLYIEDNRLIVSNSVNTKITPVVSGTGLLNLSNRCSLLLNKNIEICRHDEIFTVKVPLLYE